MLRVHIAYLLVFYLLSYSIVGQWLESSMVLHVLIQLPALVTLGYYYGKKYLIHNRYLLFLNGNGLPGILLCIFTSAYWMLPRALDSALIYPEVALIKYISLPVLVGMPLAISWPKIHPIAKAVVKIEFLTMLFRLGWLYLVSPIRLCNVYDLNEQVVLGKCFLIVAIVLSSYWILKLFLIDYRKTEKSVCKTS